jgi:RecJ-like exonuclease
METVYNTCPKCKGAGEVQIKGKTKTCRVCDGMGMLVDFEATKDNSLPKQKRDRLEQESEAQAFAQFKGKRGR